MTKCRKIEIREEDLKSWRIFLYSSVIITWIGAFMIFVQPYTIRHILHLPFLVGVYYMLSISVGPWVCKNHGYGGTCNCDFYKYNDFEPMIALGILGNVAFAFIPLSFEMGINLFQILLILSFIIATYLPQKELQPLKYPPSFLLNEIDEFQAFLMQNPNERKIVTILDAKCDFCEIQVDEITRIPYDLLQGRIKIFDLTFKEDLDPVISITLNIDTDMDKIPVPTNLIFDSGMIIEQKDGVLTQAEIEMILNIQV